MTYDPTETIARPAQGTGRLAPRVRRSIAVALVAFALPLAAQDPSPVHAHDAVATRTIGDTSRVHPADVHFMTAMIGHHAQALVMTGLLDARSTHRGMRLLAERIRVSQEDEIAAMQAWLRTRGQAVPTPVTTYARTTGAAHGSHGGQGAAHAMPHATAAHGAHGTHGAHGAHGDMPGMLTSAQLDTLAAARGTRFDRLFLRYMIAHHEGAITMVRTLFATPGAGQEPQLYGFAADVDADQQAEIRRMRALLAQLPAERRRR